MSAWTLDDITGRPCAALNGHMLAPEPSFDRIVKPDDIECCAERALQAKCERYLETRGFKRLVAGNAALPARGWFGHLAKPLGNPFMPDLMVWHEPNDRPALMIEIKTRNRFQPGQREMCERGAWLLCWSFAEFVKVFERWAK